MGYTKPIETENAIYVLSLEQHGFPEFSALQKYRPDLLAIEGVPENYKSTLELLAEGKIGPRSTHWTEMLSKSIVERPLILVDPFVTDKLVSQNSKKRLATAALVAFSLYSLASAYFRKNKAAPGVTRRRVLLGIAAFLAGEAITPSLLSVPTYFSGELGPIREQMARWNDWLGKLRSPVVEDARNAIIAEKLEQQAPTLRKRLGRKPVIMIHIGAGHHGISSYLRDSTARRNAIRVLSPKIKEGIDPK